MVKKFRDLTQKYRYFRLPPDPVYISHTVQVLFNKFTRRGKKTVARRQLFQALKQFRCWHARPPLHIALMRVLRSLRIQLILVYRRQGRTFLDVPTPNRRRQRDIINLHSFYTAVKKRSERHFPERFKQELLSLTLFKAQSPTLKQRSQFIARIHEERVWVDKRWK